MTFDFFAHKTQVDETPAPGYYEVPSTFGSAPKFKIPEKREKIQRENTSEYISSRSTLSKKAIYLGPKKSKKPPKSQSKIDCPPFYDPPSSFGNGPSHTIQEIRPESVNINPGPGDYSPEESALFSKSPAFSCGTGKRFDYFVDNTIVPPGQYTIPSTIGQSRAVIMRPPGKKPFVHKSHPGPIYNIPSTFGANCPKYTISRASREKKIEETPGPASYQQMNSLLDPHKIGTKMKGRTQLPKSQTCSAPFYDVPQGFEKKGISIGSKPIVSYDNGVPGPGEYNIEVNEKRRGISFGVKREFPDPNQDVPGPDSYNLRNEEKPQQSLSLPGPIDRSLINIAYEKTIPGPGQYQIPEKDDSVKNLTIGKRIEPKVSLNERYPPYYSSHSSLGGPSFTIGLKC